MASIGDIMAKLTLNIDNFMQNMDRARTELEKIDKKYETIDKIGQSFTNAGTKLTAGVTAPVLGLGAAVTKITAGFDSTMSKVSAISGATGNDLQALRDKAKEMGSATQFSAKEAADGFTYMAMAGWDTNQMLDGIDGIMNLAAADGLDLATTSDIVTDALTAFGLSAKDSTHFADVLAQASRNANLNVSTLGFAFKYVAPVAGALGYSVEDVSTALGLMANAGIKGEQAGTTLRGALTRLASPTGAAAALMDEYGISITNADGSMKSMDEVMKNLRSSLGGLSEAEQAQAASTIFGTEAMSGMLAIVNASEDDYNKLSSAINSADGTASEMAKTMQDNLNGSITQLKSALEGLAIEFGEVIVPVIKKVVDKITDLVNKFKELDPHTKEMIVKFALVAAAVGPMLIAVGKVITTFNKVLKIVNKVKYVFSMLGMSVSTPAIIIIAAVAAIIAIFVDLWNTSEEFRDAVMDAWEKIKTAAIGAWEDLQPVFEQLKDAFTSIWDAVYPVVEVIGTLLVEAIGIAIEWFLNLVEMIEPIVSAVIDYFVMIKEIILGVIDIFTGNWDSAWEHFGNAFEAFKGVISGIWEAIKVFFSTTWETIKSIFGESLSGIWDWICEKFNAAKNFISDCWNGIKNFFSDVWSNLKNACVEGVTNVYNTIVEWLTNALNWISQLPSKLYQKGCEMFNRMKDGVSSTVSNVVTAIKGGIGRAIDWIKDLPRQAITWGRHMIEGIGEGISNAVGGLVDKVKGVGSKIKSFLGFSVPEKGPLHYYEEWMPHMMQGMSRTLENSKHTLLDSVQGVAQNVSDSLMLNPKVSLAGMSSSLNAYGTNSTGGNELISTLNKLINEYKSSKDTPAQYNINIENMNANDANDVERLARDLESFRRNSLI